MSHNERAAIGTAATFLILHLLPLVGLPSLWAMDFLNFYPSWISVCFIFLSVVLLIPKTRTLILHSGQYLTTHISFWHPLCLCLLLLFAGILFWTLRSAIPLLGDGSKLIQELDALKQGRQLEVNRAPLVFWIVGSFYHLNIVHTAQVAFQLYSLISGLIYLGLSWWIARSLTPDNTKRMMILGGLCTAGFVQQFFGYIETYALLFPITLFYLWAGLRVLEQRLSLMIPAALLGILIPIHFVSVTLLPSLALLGYQMPGNIRHKITRTTLGPIISAIVALVVLAITGYEPNAYTATADRTPFLPIFNANGSGYALLSFTHGLNLLNVYFLTAPLFFLTLVSGRFFYLQTRDGFLGCAALFSGLFTLIANPEIGAFRDWDILSFPALPLTLWSVLILTERYHANLGSAGIIFCGAAFLHTGLWVGINAHESRAETRFEKILATTVLQKDAQSYGWETLGAHFRTKRKYDRAIEAYEHAIDARPENARHWNNLGGILYDVAQSIVRS